MPWKMVSYYLVLDLGVDAWLSGPLFWSHSNFSIPAVSCKPSSIPFIKGMVMKISTNIANFNT